MLQMIDEGKALNIVSKYFGFLESTGYVRPDLMKRFFLYIFMLDFVDNAHNFFTEEDYDLVDVALRKMFSGGGCLLPYSVLCNNRVVLGKNEYMGDLRNRITEILTVPSETDRYTEDNYMRTF